MKNFIYHEKGEGIIEDSTSFLMKVLDNVHDGVYFVTKDRKITYWNNAAERISGYTADEMLGKHCNYFTDCMPIDKDGKETYLIHKDGYALPISMHVSPITNEEGVVIGVVKVFTDKN